MSFTRTNSGISNLSLFHDAEIIVYTEGGNKSFSVEEVEQGFFNKSSTDIKFWSGIFKNSNFNKKVHFKALGSKTALKPLCEKIVSGKIENTVVAIDRDLDGFCPNSKLYNSPFILYTQGYSWENDVYIELNTVNQINSMLLEQELPEETRQLIQDSYRRYKSTSSRLLRLELVFRSQNKKFLTEVSGERFFNHQKSIYLDNRKLLLFIKKKKVELNRPVSFCLDISGVCPVMNNYGKLLCSLSLNIINHICKKYTGYKSIPKKLIEVNMIDRFLTTHKDESIQYYEKLMAELAVSVNNQAIHL